MNTKKLALFSVAFAALVVSYASYAGPFGLPDIDLTKQVLGGNTLARVGAAHGVISNEQAEVLDRGHAAVGSPLERAAEAAATYYYPGSVQMYNRLNGRPMVR